MDATTAQLLSGLQALKVSRAAQRLAPLMAFIDLLQTWNRVYNLTALQTREDIVTSHLLDSVGAHALLCGQRIADVGSGGGLPGIPLAICHPDKHFVLVEANAKKTRFVQQAIIELGLNNVSVAHCRVEAYPQPGSFETVISRAFGSLARFIDQAGALCDAQGCLLAMKGRYPHNELDELTQLATGAFRVTRVHRAHVPGLEAERHIVELRRA